MIRTSRKIYIVEDDVCVRTALSRFIMTGGHHTEAYDSAESFLESVSVDSHGILITDVRMPGMNGLQLQAMLKALWSPLQVILITGYAQKSDREHAMKAGAKAFLEKPFSEQSLSELLELLDIDQYGRR